MNNIVKPVACKIREVRRESLHEYTFRVETDIRPSHGQFLQLSIPKVGEAPISVSSFGDGWMDFTIRSVGKVTKEKLTTIYALDTDRKDGWETGFVTEFVSRIPFKDFGEDYSVVVVGPPPMMKFTGLEVLKQGVPEEKIWMSFERKMSCAVGKCGHCRIDEVYVCLDGPVFNYTQAKYLVD